MPIEFNNINACIKYIQEHWKKKYLNNIHQVNNFLHHQKCENIWEEKHDSLDDSNDDDDDDIHNSLQIIWVSNR